MKVESEILMKNLREIYFSGKNENEIDNKIGDEGCKAIFYDAKSLPNLEILNLSSKEE